MPHYSSFLTYLTQMKALYGQTKNPDIDSDHFQTIQTHNTSRSGSERNSPESTFDALNHVDVMYESAIQPNNSDEQPTQTHDFNFNFGNLNDPPTPSKSQDLIPSLQVSYPKSFSNHTSLALHKRLTPPVIRKCSSYLSHGIMKKRGGKACRPSLIGCNGSM